MKIDPVPFKLLRVTYDKQQREICHHDHGEPYAGQPFDPWKRGDLVVVGRKIRMTPNLISSGAGFTTDYAEYWYVGKRATTPSAKKQYLSFGAAGRTEPRDVTVFRIAICWRDTAAKLLGREFSTREELEQNMEKERQACVL